MRQDSPDRYCKECGADWLGEPIPKKSLHNFNSPPASAEEDWRKRYKKFEKDIAAGVYDDNPDVLRNTHFSRRIALYNPEVDRAAGYQCPDCGHVVKRNPSGTENLK